ncbi:MAG: tetratricopeptide repeat protein [Anaerolineaceae bacterium]|nr:tetratricopeptide repeat protein [Anaerolineaceae bacterium]
MDNLDNNGLFQNANAFANEGNWSAAFELLSKLFENEPKNVIAINGLGTCLFQMEQFEDAAVAFETAAALQPGSIELLLSTAMAYEKSMAFKKAENAYLKVLELDQNHIGAKKQLAVLYLQQEENAQFGLEILQSILNENPDDLETVLMLGNLYEISGDENQSLLLYHHAINLSPDNSIAKEALARLDV